MFHFAFRNLLSRPARSLLSLMGLTVAIAGMVGLFSVAEGLDRMVSATFDRIPGLMAMQPGAPIPLFSKLPADWEQEIADIDGVRVVNAEIWERANLIDGKTIVNPPRFLFGTDIETRVQLVSDPYHEDLIEGRFLTVEDEGTSNCLVSKAIAEEFGKGVGDTLTVNGHVVTIVGIYHCGSLLLDVAIILDIEVVREMTRFDEDSVSGYYIEQKNSVDDEELAERIREHFRGREIAPWQPAFSISGDINSTAETPLAELFQMLDRQIKSLRPDEEGGSSANDDPPTGDAADPNATDETDSQSTRDETLALSPGLDVDSNDDEAVPTSPGDDEHLIEVRNAADWADRLDKFSEDLNFFLMVLTGIGITIAVLSIVNTMLMSVSERIIEFGILKANGWSPWDVLKLITFESAILGLSGGVFGSFFGWVATQIINANWPTRVSLYASPQLLLFSILFSTVLGMLGGLYPAVWAMRMMPMDAIRRG